MNSIIGKIFCFGLIFAFLVAHSVKAAMTDSSTFDVKINIDPVCTLRTTAASDIDFGSRLHTDTNVTASGDLIIHCTNGTAYDVGLDDGLHSLAGVRRMAGTDVSNNGEYISYFLYLDNAHSIEWNKVNKLTGTGTGNDQTSKIFGMVPTLTTAKSGKYLDTVTATITY